MANREIKGTSSPNDRIVLAGSPRERVNWYGLVLAKDNGGSDNHGGRGQGQQGGPGQQVNRGRDGHPKTPDVIHQPGRDGGKHDLHEEINFIVDNLGPLDGE